MIKGIAQIEPAEAAKVGESNSSDIESGTYIHGSALNSIYRRRIVIFERGK